MEYVMRGGSPGIEHRDFFLEIAHGLSSKLGTWSGAWGYRPTVF
jgi:hypothetical protein